MFKNIYCDLDGVFANFHLEAVRAHLRIGHRPQNLNFHGAPLELSWETLKRSWPGGVSLQKFVRNIEDTPDYWCPEMDTFWEPIRLDPMFWYKVPPFPWLQELLEMLYQCGENIIFISTPDTTHHSYAGKRKWFIDQGLDQHELMLIKSKWRLAHPDDILIDDFQGHIKSWLKCCQERYDARGHALLFPQPWNQNHGYKDPLEFIRQYMATHV